MKRVWPVLLICLSLLSSCSFGRSVSELPEEIPSVASNPEKHTAVPTEPTSVPETSAADDQKAETPSETIATIKVVIASAEKDSEETMPESREMETEAESSQPEGQNHSAYADDSEPAMPLITTSAAAAETEKPTKQAPTAAPIEASTEATKEVSLTQQPTMSQTEAPTELTAAAPTVKETAETSTEAAATVPAMEPTTTTPTEPSTAEPQTEPATAEQTTAAETQPQSTEVQKIYLDRDISVFVNYANQYAAELGFTVIPNLQEESGCFDADLAVVAGNEDAAFKKIRDRLEWYFRCYFDSGDITQIWAVAQSNQFGATTGKETWYIRIYYA